MHKKQLKMSVQASTTSKKSVVKTVNATRVELQNEKGGPLLVDIMPRMKNVLKMPVPASATSKKTAVKTVNLKSEETIIHPSLLYVSTANYYRPFEKKTTVVIKDALSDKDFKAMNKLHADTIVAIEKEHKLRELKAAKDAEDKKKLVEAERKKKAAEFWNNVTPRGLHAAMFGHKQKPVDGKA